MQSMFNLYLFLLCYIVGTSISLELPSYIKPCKKDDPALNECALKSGNDAIPHLVKGDSTYGIPVLDPLREFGGIYDKGLNISDMVLYGLKEAKLTSILADVPNLRANTTIFVKSLRIAVDFSVDTTFFCETLVGSGKSVVDLTDVTILGFVQFEPIERDEIFYMRVVNGNINVIPKKVSYKSISFDGDQEVFERVLKAANDKWEDTMEKFGLIVDEQILHAAYLRTAIGITDRVPLEKFFT